MRLTEMLAAVYIVSAGWGLTQEQNYNAFAVAAADKALSLKPHLSMPYAVHGGARRNLVP